MDLKIWNFNSRLWLVLGLGGGLAQELLGTSDGSCRQIAGQLPMLYQHSVMAFTLARRSAIRADESKMGAANRRSQY